MSVLTEASRAAMARMLKQQETSIFLALGRGGADWGEYPPSESIDAAELMDEFGCLRVSRTVYVNEDTNGSITMSSGRWEPSDVPTRHLYMEFESDFGDGAGNTVKEVGIFVGRTVQNTDAQGQIFFVPSEIAQTGELFMVDNLDGADYTTLSANKSFAYEHVLTF